MTRALLPFGVAILAAMLLPACSGATSAEVPAGSSSGNPEEPSGSSGTTPETNPGGSSGSSGSSGASGTNPTPGPKTNGFPAKWIDGTACASEPKIQTWDYGEGTWIVRQSLCTNFEGPFVYLFVGQTKALLVDTGTGAVDLESEVTKILAGKDVELVVAHSHSHGDHVGGDGQFKGQPKTTVVGTSTSAVKQFFQIDGTNATTFDLGGRVIDVVPIPGHQAAHLAFYDAKTKLLLTGDTLYPGRLYIDDWNAYKASVPRLVAFVDAGHPVSYVLGAHIELPKTGPDYAQGAKAHPNEHALELADADLRELDAVVKAQGAQPTRTVRPNFILSP